MTLAEARRLLDECAHHPTVSPQHLVKRVHQGMARDKALTRPVIPRPKRWAHIAHAIDHYLHQQGGTANAHPSQ